MENSIQAFQEKTDELRSRYQDLGVPENIGESLVDWIMNGHRAGSFTMSVIRNDLTSAIQHADHFSYVCLKEIVTFMFCYAPMGCWGTTANIREWSEKGGLIGMAVDAEESPS